MLYEKLTQQYNKLADEEKNALLIYKSRLGRAINSLNNNPLEVQDIYLMYKHLLENPKNAFMAFTVFKSVSFSDLESFKSSLMEVEKMVKTAIRKIVLPEDVTIYRGISILEESNLVPVAKTSLVSTSFDIQECSKFLQMPPGGGYKHYLYQINLEKFSCVGVCPYAILYDEKEKRLLLTQSRDQKELIFIKEDFIFEEQLSSIISLNNGNINMILLNAKMQKHEKQEMSK